MRLIGPRVLVLEHQEDARLVLDCVRQVVRAELKAAFVEYLVRKSQVDPVDLFFDIVRWMALVRFIRDLARTVRPVPERLIHQLDDCEDTIRRLTRLLGPEEDDDAEGH